MKRKVLCALFLVFSLALAFSGTLTSAQTTPEFKLGFKILAAQIPDVVGVPLENEYFNLSTDNSEQHTSKGLLVWRKADNWTAFTNGYMTWISAQTGVQARLNTERFSWENTPVGAEAPLPASKAAPKKAPVPPAALVQGSGATAAGAAITAPATQAPAPAAAATQAPAPAPPAAASPPGTSKDACLVCHGLFDKIVSASANYTWPSGAKENPHQYVPHDSQTVPECSSCHNPHPVPPTSSDIAAMGKAQPKLCLTCHPTGF